jgi:hypothetical protein
MRAIFNFPLCVFIAIAANAATPALLLGQGSKFSQHETVKYIIDQFYRAKKCRTDIDVHYGTPTLSLTYFSRCDRRSQHKVIIDMRYVTDVYTVDIAGGYSPYIYCKEVCINYYEYSFDDPDHPITIYSSRSRQVLISYPVVAEIDANRIVRAMHHLADLNRVTLPKDPFDP